MRRSDGGWRVSPDIATITRSRDDFVAKKFAVSIEGYGNSWNDFWRRGLQQNPQNHYLLLKPFPASTGGQPPVFMSQGFVSMNARRKHSPEWIKELLRIMNCLAAPFGSQEDLLLTYGLKDQDYKLDDKATPGADNHRASTPPATCRGAISRSTRGSTTRPTSPASPRRALRPSRRCSRSAWTTPRTAFTRRPRSGRAPPPTHLTDGVRDIILGRRAG